MHNGCHLGNETERKTLLINFQPLAKGCTVTENSEFGAKYLANYQGTFSGFNIYALWHYLMFMHDKVI